MERTARTRREQQRIVLDIFLALVLSAGQRLARPPVVGHLVIIPLREDRHFGIESSHVLVEQVVLVVAAELGERLRGLGLFLEHDVFPYLAVRHFLLGKDRTIGVNGVAVVEEKIGAGAEHGRIRAHAAARFVDAPALTGGIARPHERDRAQVARRGTKATDHRFAGDRRRCKVLEANAVEDILSGRQAFDQRLGGEIGFRQRVHEQRPLDRLETVRGRNLDQHARRAIGPRPDHGGINRHIAGLDAMGDERAVGGPAQIGLGDAANGGDCGGGGGPQKEPPTRQGGAHDHERSSLCMKEAGRCRPIQTPMRQNS